jgi:hypothetical protein
MGETERIGKTDSRRRVSGRERSRRGHGVAGPWPHRSGTPYLDQAGYLFVAVDVIWRRSDPSRLTVTI